jgi:hypothetical protein
VATARNVALTPGKILLGGCRNQPRPFDYSDWVPLILRPLEQQLRHLGYIRRDPPRLVAGQEVGGRAPSRFILEVEITQHRTVGGFRTNRQAPVGPAQPAPRASSIGNRIAEVLHVRPRSKPTSGVLCPTAILRLQMNLTLMHRQR